MATNDNDDIESDASIITEYFRINKLTLNINKSAMMLFKPNFPNDNPSVMFNGVQVKSSESTKYLGLHIDSSLKFKTYIEQLRKDLTAVIAIMYKVRSFLPRHVMWTIYMSLVHSKIMYMLNIYGTSTKTELKKVFILQKRAIKVVLNVHTRYDQ